MNRFFWKRLRVSLAIIVFLLGLFYLSYLTYKALWGHSNIIPQEQPPEASMEELDRFSVNLASLQVQINELQRKVDHLEDLIAILSYENELQNELLGVGPAGE